MVTPYNPLDVRNLAESVAIALLTATPTRMDQIQRFDGAGVYAIYYTGTIDPYQLLGQLNAGGRFEVPIYVGKAVPAGARKGVVVASASTGTPLYGRLRQHATSIEQAQDLSITDFYARWLVSEAIWIPLGESLMIGRFGPVWNSIVDGFGNHAPGSGRVSGLLSRWDTLHPGRNGVPRGASQPVYWADQYPPRLETADDIRQEVRAYLAQRIQVGPGHPEPAE